MGAIEAINVLTYTPSQACAVTPTHTLVQAHTHFLPRSALTQTDTHISSRSHRTPVSLSWCLVGLCSAPAREVKCRRAGPDCTVGGEGGRMAGGVAVGGGGGSSGGAGGRVQGLGA